MNFLKQMHPARCMTDDKAVKEGGGASLIIGYRTCVKRMASIEPSIREQRKGPETPPHTSIKCLQQLQGPNVCLYTTQTKLFLPYTDKSAAVPHAYGSARYCHHHGAVWDDMCLPQCARFDLVTDGPVSSSQFRVSFAPYI